LETTDALDNGRLIEEPIELSKFGYFAWLLVLLVKQKDRNFKINEVL